MNLENLTGVIKQAAELILDEISRVETELRHKPDAFALTEKDARNEAFDLADTELDLREIREFASAISSAIKGEGNAGLLPQIETRLNALMIAAELPSIPRRGKKVIPYTKRFWSAANGLDDPKLHDAMTAAGMGDVVRKVVNANSLRSAINEYLDDHEALPKDLEKLVVVREVPSVRVNKA